LWSATAGGGPPVVAAGKVWTIGQDGVLYGLNPSTGAVQDRATIGVPANHFATASAGGGLLLAPATNRVVAFSAPTAGATGPSTTTAAPSTTTSGAPATTTSAPAAARNGTSPWGIAAAVVGALAVVGGVGWLFLRRRRTAGRSGRQ
jgi:cobalamin biosynthesis Mg chelatase CobN